MTDLIMFKNGRSLKAALVATAKISSNCTVPVEYHKLPQSPPPWKLKPERFKMVILDPKSPKSLRLLAKEYMLKSFYEEAPIPHILGFDARIKSGCQTTCDYLDKEMDAHLDSGVSAVFCDKDDMSHIVGCGFSKIWTKNADYNPIYDIDVKSWHNLAAKKVEEKDTVTGILEWRTLQSLHIYNLGQKLLSTSSKKFAFYLAMLHISSCARKGGLSSETILNTLMREFDISDCLFYCQSNFPSFDKTVYKIFPNPQIVDCVKYNDLDLLVNGERCFRNLNHLDSLKFFVEFFDSKVSFEL